MANKQTTPRISLQDILSNKSSPPFSKQEFETFLKNEYSYEFFLFLQAVEQYTALVKQLKLSEIDLVGFGMNVVNVAAANPSLIACSPFPNSNLLTALPPQIMVSSQSATSPLSRLLPHSSSKDEIRRSSTCASSANSSITQLPVAHPYECANKSDSISRQMLLKQLMKIRDEFLLSGSIYDIGLPNKYYKKFDNDVKVLCNYHPTVLNPAKQHTEDTLSAAGGLLTRFLSPNRDKVQPKKKLVPNTNLEDMSETMNLGGITMQAVMKGKTSPPYSKAEFFDFLRQNKGQHYIEFFEAVRQYRVLVVESCLPEDELRKESFKRAAGGLANAGTSELSQKKERLHKAIHEIYEEFIVKPFGKPEAMFTEREKWIIDTFKSIHTKGVLHPDIFKPLVEFVKDELRTKYFIIFMERPINIDKHGEFRKSEKGESNESISGLQDAGTNPQQKHQGKSLRNRLSLKLELSFGKDRRDSITSRSAATSEELGHVRRNSGTGPFSSTVSSRSGSGFEFNEAGSRRISIRTSDLSIQRMLSNIYPPPYSLKEFKDFLKESHDDAVIDFLLAVQEYEEFISKQHGIDESVLIGHAPSKPHTNVTTLTPAVNAEVFSSSEELEQEPQVKSFRKECRHRISVIYNTFIATDSPKDIGLSSKIRKAIYDDFSTRLHYHSSLFKGAIETCHNIVQESLFPRFIEFNTKKGFPLNAVFFNQGARSFSNLLEGNLGCTSLSTLSLNTCHFNSSIPYSIQSNSEMLYISLLEDSPNPPYTVLAFEKFLKSEFALCNWYFVKEIKAYRQFFHASPLGRKYVEEFLLKELSKKSGGKTTKIPRAFKKFHSQCYKQLESLEHRFLSGEAQDEVALPIDLRVTFHDNLSNKKIISPEILLPLKEFIDNIMVKSLVPRFIIHFKRTFDESIHMEKKSQYSNDKLTQKDLRNSGSSFGSRQAISERNTDSRSQLSSDRTRPLLGRIKRVSSSSSMDFNVRNLLSQLLLNNPPSPFTMENFEKLLQSEKLLHVWHFLQHIQEYTKFAREHAPNFDCFSSQQSPNDPLIFSFLSQCQSKLKEIEARFMHKGGEEELLIPEALQKSFLTSVTDQHNYSPEILAPMRHHYEQVLCQSCLPKFVSSVCSQDLGFGSTHDKFGKSLVSSDYNIMSGSASAVDFKRAHDTRILLHGKGDGQQQREPYYSHDDLKPRLDSGGAKSPKWAAFKDSVKSFTSQHSK